MNQNEANKGRTSKQTLFDSETPTRLNPPSSRLQPSIPTRIGPEAPTRLNAFSTGSKKSVQPVKSTFWLWTIWMVFGVLVIATGVALFFYFRAVSFVNATLGGHNAPSLLTAVASPTNTEVLVQAEVAPVVVLPTFVPRPAITATPDNTPAIVQRIRRGERVSVLVLGYGGKGHDGAFLTDTILLITYDPAHKAVSMVNIPRDFYAFIPYGGSKIGFWSKINAAFSFIVENNVASAQLSPRYRYSDDNTKIDAAANLTKDIVEEITGIPIDYWVTFSFDGFRRLIDAIGGVDVVVDTTFDDYEYPANDNPEIDASYKHIHFEAGLNHLNRERAIEFARSRKSSQDGNDFNRSKRQMKVVQAVKEKLIRPDLLFKTLSIMDALQGNMRTSLSFSEASGLTDYFRTNEGAAKISNVLFISQILSSNFLYDSTSTATGYILIPQAGQGNYKDIQDWLQLGLNAPELRYENMKVQVQNASGLWKYGGSVSERLQTTGFEVLPSIWANPSSVTTILDYTKGKARYSLRTLSGLFPTATIKTGERTAEGGPDLVVVLGQDYAEPTATPVPPKRVTPSGFNTATKPSSTPRVAVTSPPASRPWWAGRGIFHVGIGKLVFIIISIWMII